MKSPLHLLKTVFGYDSFRENQEEVIRAILAGQDVFTAMPTGGGKSLCYQIPGLVFEGLTLVISPLIALMKDQVDEANARGIPAAVLNSTLTVDEISRVYARLYNGEIKLLYISPERLALDGYIERLQEFQVSFFAIDEAHCLSEWGHDFRPDYLYLSKIRSHFPNIPMAAFTATATEKVQSDIIRILELKNPYTVRASFNRKELGYQVLPKTDVLSQIASFIQDHPRDSGIVYRTSRKDVEKTASFLQEQGIRALHYHAGLSTEERTKNQELFNNDDVDVICATTAFGMGINKSNIRYVVHGDLPKSMEGYYQETGRAGRDGLASECILFFSAGDIAKQQFFIEQIGDFAEREKCKKNLNSLVSFATLQQCRRKQILAYFGEEHHGNCDNCDVCNTQSDKLRATVDAQKLLSAIARTNENFGTAHIIDIVYGANTEKIRSRGHDKLKTFGTGKDKNKRWWQNIVNELIGQQAIFRDSERFNILCMTDLGREILYGKQDIFINKAFANAASAAGKKETASRSHILLKKNRQMPADYAHTSPADENLFQALRVKRSEIAKQNGVPPYIVFSDKSLRDMAMLKPSNKDEFLLVSGVGTRKLKVYGSQFLAVIRENLNG